MLVGNCAGKVNWAPSVDPSMPAGDPGLVLKLPQQGGGCFSGANLMGRDPSAPSILQDEKPGHRLQGSLQV